MADILSYSLRSTFAKEFYQSLTDPKSNDKYYMYYGRPQVWDDDVVPLVKDTIKEQNDAKRNIMFYNLITPTDVYLVAPRYNWESGTIYDQYEDDIQLWSESKKYYVLVDDAGTYSVYLCISNNLGAQSTSSPSGTDVEEVLTEDGYVWKYLYTLTIGMEDFLTNDYLPVVVIDKLTYMDERALALNVKANATNGSIEKIEVDVVGDSFNDLVNNGFIDQVNYTVMGVDTGELIFSVGIADDHNTASNYYNLNYIVYFENGKVGTIKTYTVNANNTATIELCELYPNDGIDIQINDVYCIIPKVNIVGNGHGAIGIPIFVNDFLTEINVIDGGEDYGFANAFFLVDTDAELTPIIPPNGGHGYDLDLELKPTRLLIVKDINFNPINDERYFGAGSTYSQFGIVKNVLTNNNQVISEPNVEFNMVFIKQNGEPLVGVSGIDFTHYIDINSGEVNNPFNGTLTLTYYNFDVTTGIGDSSNYNNIYTPPNQFYKVGDLIENAGIPILGAFIGKVISATQDDTPSPNGSIVTLQHVYGSFRWNNIEKAKNITQNNRILDLTATDSTVTGVADPMYNQNMTTFYTFVSYKNSTGQGGSAAGGINYGRFFDVGDIVTQKDINLAESYRGIILGIIEPGMASPISIPKDRAPYGTFNDSRRCTTIILGNISGTPSIPTLGNGFSPSNNTKQLGCFYNVTKNNQLLLLSAFDRIDGIVDNTNQISCKNITVTSISDLLDSTHILGNESFSVAEIKQDTMTVDPDNSARLLLKIINPTGDFIPATMNGVLVTAGEGATFLKKKNETTISYGFDSIYDESLYVFSEDYDAVATEDVNQYLTRAISNIKKIQVKRSGSTVLNSTIIPSGSYLYKEATETEDAVAGYVVSLGTSSIVNTVDSVIDVYYLAEKGEFIINEVISIVVDPFVKDITAVNEVSLTTQSNVLSYNSVFVNKYSGEVLYTQNTEPIPLATDTHFSTRILLGF